MIMKYGIGNNSNNQSVCANCGKILMDINSINYCSNCGAPLTPIAISNFLTEIEKINDSLLADLKSIAIENKTDRLSEILKIYNEDI